MGSHHLGKVACAVRAPRATQRRCQPPAPGHDRPHIDGIPASRFSIGSPLGQSGETSPRDVHHVWCNSTTLVQSVSRARRPGLAARVFAPSQPCALICRCMIPARIIMGITPLTRILIVDDDPEVVALLREFLERNGYAVDSAANGREGLSRIVAARPDLVLLDIRMPDMDGMRALQLARAIDPTLAVIMVTGNEDIDLARETLRAGAVDYVAKPLDLEYLARAVAVARRR